MLMTDVHKPETRSWNMSRIRSKDTKPELIVRKFLHKNGLRYRLNDPKLPGKPDIVLPKYRTIILVHGCFWHGHENCHYFVVPQTRTEWWLNKIEQTKQRDHHIFEQLTLLNWNVITIWECQLKPRTADETLNSLLQALLY